MADRPIRRILFVMTDQQRADYLGCMGHPTLRTPHLDALAADGTLFTRAYCSAPICGSSRMSFYTGRSIFTHGATWNGVPLSLAERTLGEHLRPLGYRTAVVGKTHMTVDREGFARLGLDPADPALAWLVEGGFEPVERDDGLHPDTVARADLPYNVYLRAQGYDGDNPWNGWANSAEGPDGEVLSGWLLRHCHLPARVREEHSETAYMTDRAIDFIDRAGDAPWCLHLSYIKPHWPYIAPAPYHALYGPDDVPPANRGNAERARPHPVHGAFMAHEDSRTFARDEVRQRVIPPYMGLISQIDAHLGRLFAHLKARGLWDDTLIVFTSDHGDMLGDHWLGEKELFYEEAVRIPLIVRDPRSGADGGRGRVCDALVEAVDLVPTFLAAAGGRDPGQWLEGRSLLPLVAGAPAEAIGWRREAMAETDYAMRGARLALGQAPQQARGVMLRGERYKYIRWIGQPEQLFDLVADPQEQADIAGDPASRPVLDEMRGRLIERLMTRRSRVTMSDDTVAARTDSYSGGGFVIGEW